ncbi:MAG: hypothetical protein QOJ96_432 [Alphaproteobacteria bacterium]|jgi:hypothetical protein|nr:hypothetical protein [Alphaproteobacteria bacterium]
MILKASQRGGARQLATHLTNDLDNDHVTVQELRGFLAGDLKGALSEVQAVAKGTRCTQFMFSLSLNPPKDAAVGIDVLMSAVDRAEETLGLKDQPRAVIIHEKNGRRHAHVVWSRIDADEMKAINMPHFKNRLTGLSKELYLENGWELPDGHKTNGWKNPLNFTLAEWQQAKRLDLDPREIKQIFRTAWERSDNLASFRNALEEHGYYLAQGDRRGFVALGLDAVCAEDGRTSKDGSRPRSEPLSVARWAGVKTKELNQKLGKPDALPGIDEVRKTTRQRVEQNLRQRIADGRKAKSNELKPLLDEVRRTAIMHRAEREKLTQLQEKRWKAESKARGERFRRGLGAVLDILSGRLFTTRKQNDREAYEGFLRDRAQREALVEAQAREIKPLHERVAQTRTRHRDERMRFARRVAEVLALPKQEERDRSRMRARERPRERGLEL